MTATDKVLLEAEPVAPLAGLTDNQPPPEAAALKLTAEASLLETEKFKGEGSVALPL